MKPRALDLFCGGGLVALGLQAAGFDVFGVDLKRSRSYPGVMIEHDVLTLTPAFIRQFQFAWASPPCQRWTDMKHAPNAKGDAHPDLITPTRALLKKAFKKKDTPYVIENVERARAALHDPICLCGTSFGLGAQAPAGRAELQRHRLFECHAVAVEDAPPCQHSGGPVVSVFGGHARIRSAKHGGRGTRENWPDGHRPPAIEAMGLPSTTDLTLAEISEGVPPAYAEWIGRRALQAIAR